MLRLGHVRFKTGDHPNVLNWKIIEAMRAKPTPKETAEKIEIDTNLKSGSYK